MIESESTSNRLPHQSEWKLIYVGLSLIQVSSVVLLVAGLAGWGIEIRYANSKLKDTILILPLSVGLASLFNSFIGLCLCWNPPAYSSLRKFSRSFVVDIVIAGICLVGGFIINEDGERFWIAALALFGISFFGAYWGIIQWSLFLQGIANEMQNRNLSHLIRFLVQVFLIGLVFGLPVFYIEGIKGNFLLLFTFCFVGFIIHIVVLHRVRQAIKVCTNGPYRLRKLQWDDDMKKKQIRFLNFLVGLWAVKKKLTLYMVFLVGLCALIYLVVGSYHVPDKITKSNCDKIKGMTYRDVEAILGPPNAQWLLGCSGGDCDYEPCWEGKIGRIRVHPDGKGYSAKWFAFWEKDGRLSHDEHPVGLDRIGEWLGLW
jgi:hypothetical protein